MKPTIYTWGYGGHDIGDLVNVLGLYGIDVVVDVRRSPFGPQREFNRDALKRVLPAYEHWGSLGNDRSATHGWVPIDPVVAERSLDSLASRVAAGEVVLLMCCEKAHEGCHRTNVAELLARRCDAEIKHLPEPAQPSLF